MPRPIVFADVREFRAALGSSENAKRVRDFFDQRCDSIQGIVKLSVAGNTFRAFPLRRLDLALKPSEIYRSWATKWLEDALGEFRGIRSRRQMRSFVAVAAARLDKHWSRCTGGKNTLGFGRAAKLLNLTLKHAIWLGSVTARERETLIPLLEIPLDSYTLQGVRRLLPALRIPPNATMSFVKDRAHYEAIQDAILGLCQSRFRPVDYEVAAWNHLHPAIDPRHQVAAIRAARSESGKRIPGAK